MPEVSAVPSLPAASRGRAPLPLVAPVLKAHALLLAASVVLVACPALVSPNRPAVAMLWLLVWCALLCVAGRRVLVSLIFLSAISPLPVPAYDPEGLPLFYISVVVGAGMLTVQQLARAAVANVTVVLTPTFRRAMLMCMLALLTVWSSMLFARRFDADVGVKVLLVFGLSLVLVFAGRFDFLQARRALYYGAVVLMVQVVLQATGHLQGLSHTRAFGAGVDIGAFLGPNLGGFVGSALLLLIADRRCGTLPVGIASVTALAVLYVAGYRTWFIALAASLAAFGVCQLLVGNDRNGTVSARPRNSIVILTVAAPLYLPFVYDALLALWDKFWADLVVGRFPKWRAAIDLMSERPLQGLGYGQLDVSGYPGVALGSGTYSADSFYVNLLAQVGVLGVFILVLCFVGYVRLLWGTWRFEEPWMRICIGAYLFYWAVGAIFWESFGSGASGFALALVNLSFLVPTDRALRRRK